MRTPLGCGEKEARFSVGGDEGSLKGECDHFSKKLDTRYRRRSQPLVATCLLQLSIKYEDAARLVRLGPDSTRGMRDKPLRRHHVIPIARSLQMCCRNANSHLPRFRAIVTDNCWVACDHYSLRIATSRNKRGLSGKIIKYYVVSAFVPANCPGRKVRPATMRRGRNDRQQTTEAQEDGGCGTFTAKTESWQKRTAKKYLVAYIGARALHHKLRR